MIYKYKWEISSNERKKIKTYALSDNQSNGFFPLSFLRIRSEP